MHQHNQGYIHKDVFHFSLWTFTLRTLNKDVLAKKFLEIIRHKDVKAHGCSNNCYNYGRLNLSLLRDVLHSIDKFERP